MYGPATLLVLSIGQGTHVFTLDHQQQAFVLSQQTAQIAQETAEFAINASNQRYWEPAMQRYISECLQGAEGPRGRDFNMRWCASMVMDVHRILTRGGVFLYPRDHKQPVKAGRLRLLYEANPMSLLVTQAGGESIDGLQDILSIQPTASHQRVPVLLGAKQEIQRLREYHQQATS
jgi:fructose-1,6-bisphosphatase I/sedoheptulose-1,7-bisphosphatase/fructose-1,6-bisphosphatase I